MEINSADVNAKTKTGWNALMLPCWTGHIDVVRVLLQKGADPSGKNEKGQTAMMLAAEQGHTEVVELLKTHGAKE